MAVLPSKETETDQPSSAFPVAPVPTSFCWCENWARPSCDENSRATETNTESLDVLQSLPVHSLLPVVVRSADYGCVAIGGERDRIALLGHSYRSRAHQLLLVRKLG